MNLSAFEMEKPVNQLEDFVESLRNLDISIFTVPSQTGPSDRKFMLALQNFVRNMKKDYVYLEIGSHLGGTLVPHLLDPQCRQIISVDLRPLSQMDERGIIYDYDENSTQRMLSTLESHVPASAFGKLITFETDIADVSKAQVPAEVDLALIDGEHTNVAVFRDFMSVKKFLSRSCVVICHDAHLLCDGLQNIEAYLKESGVVFESLFLSDCLFVIVMGDWIPVVCSVLRPMSIERNQFITCSRILLWRKIAENLEHMTGNQLAHMRVDRISTG